VQKGIGYTGFTPLHYAVFTCYDEEPHHPHIVDSRMECVSKMLAAGAKINRVCGPKGNRQTPLDVAKKKRQCDEFLEWFRQQGALYNDELPCEENGYNAVKTRG